METINNKLPPYAYQFFNKLSNYLDLKLYFYGSVQRKDYFPQESDIDVGIFTDNVYSTITKMQIFLNKPRHKFKKLVWRLNINNQLVTGYKVTYKEPENNLITEFSIYDEKYKEGIIMEYNRKKELPFYASQLLILLKFFFYQLKIISYTCYSDWKKFILSHMIGIQDGEFIVIDLKEDDETDNKQ
jgi:predicted nucleotidyltransferase